MKRILVFQKSDVEYQVAEDEKVIFSINISEMKFDVKEFFDAFCCDLDFVNMEGVEIENTLKSDKDATRIYNCIKELIEEIFERVKNEEIVKDKTL